MLISVRDKASDALAKKAMKDAARAAMPAGTPVTERKILVADVMNPSPMFLTEDVTIRDAIVAMRAGDLTGIPVVDTEANLTGFLTDGDLLRYLSPSEEEYLTDGRAFFQFFDENSSIDDRLRELLDMPVTRLATKHHIHALEVHDEAEAAFAMLSEKHIRKAPVLADGKLVGTLSRRDIINAALVHEEASAS